MKSAKKAERAYKLADTGGLFVLVQPNGSKLWRYKSIPPLMRLAPLAGLVEVQFRIGCEWLTTAWLKGDLDVQAKVQERIESAVAGLAGSVRKFVCEA